MEVREEHTHKRVPGDGGMVREGHARAACDRQAYDRASTALEERELKMQTWPAHDGI